MSTGNTAATTPKILVVSSSPAKKRGVFGVIKRELRRRSAIEPIIGHLKAEGHLGRRYLKGRARGCCERHPLSRLSATTSAAYPPGSENSGASSCSCYGARSPVQPRSIRLLNGRLQRPAR